MADQQWMHVPLDSMSTPRRTSHGSDGTINPGSLRDNTGSPEGGSSGKGPAIKIRRRNRLITSCLECRRRKLKCDKTAPCTNCTRFKRDCLYLASNMDATSAAKLADIKEKMGALERGLEREVAGKTVKQLNSASNSNDAIDDGVDDENDELVSDSEVLEPTSLSTLDGVYEDNGDDDSLMDLGVQMGKMRISERIGGWIRPQIVQELNDSLQDLQASRNRWSTGPQILQPLGKDHVKLQASPKSFIGPSNDFIAPSSSFAFPGTNLNTTLLDYLPSRGAADQLLQQYWNAVHLMTKVIHRPSFEVQYNHFWQNISAGTEPLPSIQALMLATMFAAAVSMNEDQVAHKFRTSRSALIDTLKTGVEMALAKANFLRTTKTLVMQAFVVYLTPMMRSEISRAHSALIGAAIRLAECMSLHRDGELYSLTPIETHIRRMIWHNLCWLDIKASEATGPRPQIKGKDEYDTKFPLNVNDNDLMQANPPREDANHWTEMSLMRMRAECTEIRRMTWADLQLVDKRKKSLTSVLVRIQKFRTALESRYFPMLDLSKPFHKLSKHIINLNINGMFIQVLHRYMFSTTTRMPDRLRQLLIEAGVAQMENAIALETDPSLAMYSWFKGAFNQYQSALLLMVEVYAFPQRRDAQRIWKSLDYIFDIPPHLSPRQKAELVITDLRDRMEIFHQMRRVRATTQVEEKVLGLSKSSLRNPDQSSPTTAYRTTSPPLSAIAPGNAASGNEFDSPQAAPMAASSTGGSRQGSAIAGDTTMMDEIDWNEWNKWFDPGVNTGELDLPDFNFASFDSGYAGPPMDSSMLINSLPSQQQTMPLAEDLSDINMPPGLIPTPNYMAWRQQTRGQQR